MGKCREDRSTHTKKDKNTLYQNSILSPKIVRLELLSNFEFPALQILFSLGGKIQNQHLKISNEF